MTDWCQKSSQNRWKWTYLWPNHGLQFGTHKQSIESNKCNDIVPENDDLKQKRIVKLIYNKIIDFK